MNDAGYRTPADDMPVSALRLFEATPGSHVLLRADAPRFTVVAATPDYLKTSGSTREALIGKSLFDSRPSYLHHEADTDLLISLNELLATGTEQRLTTRHHRHTSKPVTGTDGGITHIIQTIETVTQEATDQAHSLFMQVPLSVYILRGDELVIEMANAYTCSQWGRGEDIIGKPLLDVLPELGRQGYAALFREVMASGEIRQLYNEPITLNRNGHEETCYYNFIYKPYYIDGGTAPAGVLAVGNEVTDEVLTKNTLAENTQRLDMAVEIGGLGDFSVNVAADSATYSRQLMDWFGLDGQQSSLRTILDSIHPEDKARVSATYGGAIAGTNEGKHDITYRTIGSGGQVHHLRSMGTTRFEKGAAVSVTGIIQDVTEQVLARRRIEDTVTERTHQLAEANEALQVMNRELQRSNQHLEEFAHAASHDLKEPIRKIQVFTGRLKAQLDGQLSETDKGLLERIESASTRMGLLVDDLLLYSHVSQRPHRKEEINLNEKIRRVLEDLELHVQEKSAVIKTAQLPTIQGYRRQLQQLFQNLISNALKYNRPGVAPEISITSELAEAGGRPYYCISVSDKGIGFEEQYASKIFQMFTRLHGKHEYAGTGVGLSIVKKVVENHDGFIKVDSKVGTGSNFKIYLPAEE